MRSLLQTADGIRLIPFAKLSPEESLEILSVRNEPEVRRNMYAQQVIDVAEHRRWMADISARRDVKWFAVTIGGPIIGGVGLTAIAPTHRRSDWAFYLSTNAQGSGLGSALEFKFLCWAFGAFGLNKLNCEVLAFNEPVIALHRKFGFVEEGRRRAHFLSENGETDSVLLGLTAAEWTEQEQKLRKRLFK